MIAAEKWNEYQKNYNRYGFEMKPAKQALLSEDLMREDRLVRAKDKLRLVLLTIFAGVLGICLIITAAYSAQTKYEINSLLANADIVRGEIENLNVSIKSATNITIIEEKATTELGMVYPAMSQVAYLEPTDQNIENFALTLKQIAYKE